MNSRINKKLCLNNDGKTVHVKGPILQWDPDEVSAIFTVTIKQITDSGATASATGSSQTYFPSAHAWDADAIVTTGPELEYGPATAYATATIQLTNRTVEKYDWVVLTRLVDCRDGDPDQGEDN
jgi:hypothetical protein